MSTVAAIKQATLQDEFAAIIGCKAENVQKCLYALGIRTTCSRCGGSGHYSRCQMYGTTCFGCAGKGDVATKLSKKTLEQVKAKIAAGELDAVKARWQALTDAKRAIRPALSWIEIAYRVISEDYTAAGHVFDGLPYEEAQALYASEWWKQVYRAQTLNNVLRWDRSSRIAEDVNAGRRKDYVEALAELTEIAEMIEALAAEWRRFGWAAEPDL